MTPEELEQLRRSVVMVDGSSIGPFPKQTALDLIEEVAQSRRETVRYREAVQRLHQVLEALTEN